jgi:hypothetical protein
MVSTTSLGLAPSADTLVERDDDHMFSLVEPKVDTLSLSRFMFLLCMERRGDKGGGAKSRGGAKGGVPTRDAMPAYQLWARPPGLRGDEHICSGDMGEAHIWWLCSDEEERSRFRAGTASSPFEYGMLILTGEDLKCAPNVKERDDHCRETGEIGGLDEGDRRRCPGAKGDRSIG